VLAEFAARKDDAARLRAKVDADLERVRKALELIRRMNRIYQERLDGNRK
jgi:hypothetical protein